MFIKQTNKTKQTKHKNQANKTTGNKINPKTTGKKKSNNTNKTTNQPKRSPKLTVKVPGKFYPQGNILSLYKEIVTKKKKK